MKRGLKEKVLSSVEHEIVQQILINWFFVKPESVKDLSWLEALALISNGKLLAKIMYKLEEVDLKIIYTLSKTVCKVCKQYQLHERFYTGKAYTFGRASYGLLGNGRTDNHNVGIPVQIEGITEPVASISCGSYHTGIVTVSGKAYTFGNGEDGKLGDGRTDDHDVATPTQVEGITEHVASISCGLNHTGILTVSGKAYIFGDGEYGKLGDGRIDDHDVATPTQIEEITEPIASISCGHYHTGIVTVSGKAYTFGESEYRRLGDGRTDYHSVGIPVQIEGITEPVASISCGTFHTGIVTVSGKAYTFGSGKFGRLGDGITDDHDVGIPTQIEEITEPIASISCGHYHTGIVTVSGKSYTFGYGFGGRLGNGRTDAHDVGIPIQVQGITEPVASISCGRRHTGIVTVSGKAYTFGYGGYGRLGNDRTDDHSVGTPSIIEGITENASFISCGAYHTGIVTMSESSLKLDIN